MLAAARRVAGLRPTRFAGNVIIFESIFFLETVPDPIGHDGSSGGLFGGMIE
jgi:hypothetical protein